MPGLPLQRMDALGREGKLRLGSVPWRAWGHAARRGQLSAAGAAASWGWAQDEATKGLGQQRVIRWHQLPRG